MSLSTSLLAGLAGLGVLAMLILSRPWWWRRIPRRVQQRRANIAAYRGRLAEIGRDQAAGLLHSAESDALRAELGTRLLVDAEPEEEAPVPPGRWSGLGLLLVLSAPLLAAALYWAGGSWRMQAQIAAAEPEPISPQVVAMVETLAAKMKTNPEDTQGWTLLGRSYFMLHRYTDSAQAYHEANARNGGDPETLDGEGEAQAFANGSQVPDSAAALFDRALAIAPDDTKALWYGGLADAQSGRLQRAHERWTRLSTQEIPEEMKSVLARGIAELDASANAAAQAPAMSAAGSGTPPPSGPPLSLHLRVRLSPKLGAGLPPSAILYVFAKADGGPPMPLAVSRQALGNLPADVTLDDTMAMAPTLHLSAYPRYRVVARISRSGEAREQSGDLEGSALVERADAPKTAEHPVEITIDHALP